MVAAHDLMVNWGTCGVIIMKDGNKTGRVFFVLRVGLRVLLL